MEWCLEGGFGDGGGENDDVPGYTSRVDARKYKTMKKALLRVPPF